MERVAKPVITVLFLLAVLVALLAVLPGQGDALAQARTQPTPPQAVPLAERATAAGHGVSTPLAYEDVPASPIAIDGRTECGTNKIIERTFVVAESFTLFEVQLGFNANHTFRGDIVVQLESPSGTVVEAISADAGDAQLDYDLLLDDHATDPINDGDDDDTAEPYYDRMAMPSQPLAAFQGESSQGTWTLTICDDWALVDDGTYNRSRLVLAPPPSNPALVAAKDVSAQVTSPGAVLAYEMTISNKGAGDAVGVELADPLPQGVAYVAGTLTTQGGPPAILDAGLVSWQGTVTAGHVVTVTYQAEVLGTETLIVNTSTISHSSLAEPLVRSATSQVFPGYEGVYANEGTYEIPDDECASSLLASVQVPDPIVIDRLHVGVGLVHPWRGDITATLESPLGTTVALISSDSANSFDNYDVLLGDSSPNPINDGTNDNPEIPFFERHAMPANPLAAFSGEQAQGTWVLTLCDTSAFDAGRLDRVALFFNGPPLIRPAIALDLQPDSVQVTAGEPLTFTLVVTNPGDVPLSNVVVAADACDTTPAWQGGDTNGDSRLDVNETWIYSCSIADVGTVDFVNVATANALDPNGDPVQEALDSSPVDVIHPAIALDLEPDSVQVAAGEPLAFTLVVTNAGDVSLSDVVATADTCDAAPAWQGGDTNGDGKLDLAESWTYTCSIANVGTVDFVNVATANALDPNGDPVQEALDSSLVDVIHPSIALDLQPDSAQVAEGEPLAFTLVVTNAGDVSLSDVVATADACDAAPAWQGGDTNGDGKLDLAESWTYACSIANVGTVDFVNVATANALDPNGDPVQEVLDSSLVDVIGPAISLDLRPDSVQAAAGEPLTFTLVVTNPGDVPLSNVVVTAGACDAAPALQGGDTNGDGKLEVNETWTYTCSIADVGSENFTVVATANAEDPNGDPVAESRDSSPVAVTLDVFKVFLPVVLTKP